MIYPIKKLVTPSTEISRSLNVFNMQDEEVSSKMDEYTKYVQEHIDNVQTIYDQKIDAIKDFIAKGISDVLKEDYCDLFLEKLVINIYQHDQSKMSIEEFEGYRAKFYPTKLEQSLIEGSDKYKQFVEDRFNMSWVYHAHTNKHHPEFWITKDYKDNHWEEIYVRMSVVYIIEMLIDWAAMGLKFGGTAAKYYKEHGHEKPLHHETREELEKILYIFE